MAADVGTTVLTLHEVTHHAVIRYCQRILGVELTAQERANKSPVGIAEALCKRAGTTCQKVAARILTPAIAAAVAARLEDQVIIKTPEFRAVVKNGYVLTINAPKEWDKLRLKTRGEHRRRPSYFRKRGHA